MENKNGFTLAEVLITLGVIGVVAAMTLPTLIQNYKKKAWTTQLQKSYSMWEQAFQKMMADGEVQKLADTSVWASKGNTYCSGANYKNSENCVNFVKNLNKYIKITGVENYGNKIKYIIGDGYVNEADKKYLVLSDGTMVYLEVYGTPSTARNCDTIKSLGGSMCSDAGTFRIDVNGQRGPNTYGRDVFLFKLSDEGKLYPLFGKDFAIYDGKQVLEKCYKYWGNKPTDREISCGTPGGGITGNNIEGAGCAARIMENGWRMDY